MWALLPQRGAGGLREAVSLLGTLLVTLGGPLRLSPVSRGALVDHHGHSRRPCGQRGPLRSVAVSLCRREMSRFLLRSVAPRLACPPPPSAEGRECPRAEVGGRTRWKAEGAESVSAAWTRVSLQVWGPRTSGPSPKFTVVDGPHCPGTPASTHQEPPMLPCLPRTKTEPSASLSFPRL